MRRQVERELRVAIRVVSKMCSVQPDVGVHVDAFKAELHLGARGQRVEFGKCFAIPAHAANRPSRRGLSFGLIGVERARPRRSWAPRSTARPALQRLTEYP